MQSNGQNLGPTFWIWGSLGAVLQKGRKQISDTFVPSSKISCRLMAPTPRCLSPDSGHIQLEQMIYTIKRILALHLSYKNLYGGQPVFGLLTNRKTHRQQLKTIPAFAIAADNLAVNLQQWRRQLGRPHIRWLSTVQQDPKQHQLTLPEAADLAQNHPLWRITSSRRMALRNLRVACQKWRRRMFQAVTSGATDRCLGSQTFGTVIIDLLCMTQCLVTTQHPHHYHKHLKHLHILTFTHSGRWDFLGCASPETGSRRDHGCSSHSAS